LELAKVEVHMPEEIIPFPICGNSDFHPLFKKDGYNHEVCRNDGLIRINPQPGDEELEAIYNNADFSYYEHWGRAEDIFQDMKRLTFKRIFSLLPPPEKQARLLDIGAATGILMQVAQNRGYEVYGIEVSRSGAEAIGRKFGPDRVFCGYFNEDFTHWDDLRFDVVCLIDCLEHVRRPDLVLAKIHSMLNDNGKLVICLPDTSSFSSRLFGRYWPYYTPEHLWSFSRQNISVLLRNQGFTPDRIKAGLKYLNLEYVHNILNSKGHFQLLVKILNLTMACLPQPLRRYPLPLYVGQMVIAAHKMNNTQRNNES
jgi:SAM-dependent methyltransferase